MKSDSRARIILVRPGPGPVSLPREVMDALADSIPNCVDCLVHLVIYAPPPKGPLFMELFHNGEALADWPSALADDPVYDFWEATLAVLRAQHAGDWPLLPLRSEPAYAGVKRLWFWNEHLACWGGNPTW